MKVRFVPLWTVAVIAAAAAFVVHLAIRFETVRLGYEVSEARADQESLVQDRRLLLIEAATLRQAGRVEAIARRSLSMDAPLESQIIHMERVDERRGSAGRVR